MDDDRLQSRDQGQYGSSHADKRRSDPRAVPADQEAQVIPSGVDPVRWLSFVDVNAFREGMLKLFCAVIGQPSVFPINIEVCESVGDVKDAIKEKKRRVVRCDADQIRLFVAKKNGGSWSMTDDAQDEDAKLLKQGKMSRGIQALLMQGELDPTFEIGDYVDEDAPTRRVIHMLVQLPRLLDAMAAEEKKKAAAQSTFANVPMEAVEPSLEDKPAAPLPQSPVIPAPIRVPARVESASDRASVPSPAMARRSKRLKPNGSGKK